MIKFTLDAIVSLENGLARLNRSFESEYPNLLSISQNDSGVLSRL